jgi:hypothetical protein
LVNAAALLDRLPAAPGICNFRAAWGGE